MNALSVERQTQVTDNRAWLQQHPELMKKIISYHRNFIYPEHPNTDIQAGLYLNGFWSSEEDNSCRRFQQVSSQEKSSLTESLKTGNLRTLAIRILGRNFPSVLTKKQSQEFSHYFEKIKASEEIIDFRGNKRLTPAAAIQDILELRKQELTMTQHKLLNELENYLLENF